MRFIFGNRGPLQKVWNARDRTQCHSAERLCVLSASRHTLCKALKFPPITENKSARTERVSFMCLDLFSVIGSGTWRKCCGPDGTFQAVHSILLNFIGCNLTMSWNGKIDHRGRHSHGHGHGVFISATHPRGKWTTKTASDQAKMLTILTKRRLGELQQYLQRGPLTAENKSTTHHIRMHRTHKLRLEVHSKAFLKIKFTCESQSKRECV